MASSEAMAEEKADPRETVTHMLSEFAREVAALVLVFVPLDYLLKGETIGPYFRYESAAVVLFSFFLLLVGISLERGMKK
jgi:hypothetical protein